MMIDVPARGPHIVRLNPAEPAGNQAGDNAVRRLIKGFEKMDQVAFHFDVAMTV